MDFLDLVASYLSKEIPKTKEITLILPTKRAGLFFRKAWASQLDGPAWVPETTTFDRWIANLTGASYMDGTEQLLYLHEAYNQVFAHAPTTIDSFSGWGSQLCRDFEEMERYLLDRDAVFGSMSDIEQLNRWMKESKGQDDTLPRNYLAMWSRVAEVYSRYRSRTQNLGKTTQGLAFRMAAEQINAYMEQINRKNQFIVFAGFNAVSASETKIIQTLIDHQLGVALWDFDESLTNHPESDAGVFVRKILKWPCYRRTPISFRPNSMNEVHKNIHIHEAMGELEQAYLLPEILENTPRTERTAIVLADEKILPNVLLHLPEEETINVTMGYPMMLGSASEFYMMWLHTWLRGGGTYVHSNLLEHPFIKKMTKQGKKEDWEPLIRPKNGETGITGWLTAVRAFTSAARQRMEGDPAFSLDLEMLYGLWKSTNRISDLLERFPHLNESPKIFAKFFRQMIQGEKLDFHGEPLEGLQVMGVLETRALDFDHIIMLSVNEGVIPRGRQLDSSLPFDVKKHYQLPTFLERDAVFAYHFYRLLSRAKTIHLIHSAVGPTGNERSRFIQQLELDYGKHPHINLKKHHHARRAHIRKLAPLEHTKHPWVMERLHQWSKGISASALKSYLNDPQQFYFEKVLDANKPRVKSEDIDPATLGTIVHETLEDLYKDISEVITEDLLLNVIKPRAKEVLDNRFTTNHWPPESLRGKNFLQYNLAEFRVSQAINYDLQTVRAGNKLEILDCEAKLNIPFTLSSGEEVWLKGTIDRVDRINGALRIMDYKTGSAKISKPKDLIQNGFGKNGHYLQVGVYTLLYMGAHTGVSLPIDVQILSFKNIDAKNTRRIERDEYEDFRQALQNLIEEIMNPNIPFTPAKPQDVKYPFLE